MPPRTKLKVRTVRLTDSDWRSLEKLGKRAEREVAWLIRQAIAEYLERQTGRVA